MHHAPDPATVTSMDELRAFLVALGDNPESVGYADDRDQRRGTGELLISRGPEDCWVVSAYERDEIYDKGHFASEREALQHLAAQALSHARRTVRLTEAEAAELAATREARLQAVLERSRRARDAQGRLGAGRRARRARWFRP